MYVAVLITTCSGTLVHQLLHRNEQNTVQWQLNVNGKKKEIKSLQTVYLDW